MVVVEATVVVVGAIVVVVVGAIVVVVVVVVGAGRVVVVGHHHHHVVVVAGATVDVTAACVAAVVAEAGVVVFAAAVLTGASVGSAGAVVLADRVAVVLGRMVWVVVAPLVVDVAALEDAFVTSTPRTWTPAAEVLGTAPRFPTLTVSGRWGRSATRPITTAASSASASNTSARWRGSGVSRIGTAPIVAVDAPVGADGGPLSRWGRAPVRCRSLRNDPRGRAADAPRETHPIAGKGARGSPRS